MMTNLFDKKDVFSWANREEASKYIDTKGYFGDSLKELEEQIKEQNLKKLLWIDDSNAICFHPAKQTVTEPNMAFFLPIDKIKKPEPKKWRPFKYMDEFSYHIFMTKNFHSISHNITVEDKETSIRYRLTIIGEFEKGLVLPIYGALTFQELFDRLNINNELHQIGWQPFGVEE